MSRIVVKTASGLVDFRYAISTPLSSSVQTIDRSLPTILFIHPVFVPQEIYHAQFADAQLRRFNLIALDNRCHGETSGPICSNYDPQVAAEDVFKFMEALNLPACHIFGMSTGARVATQLAITYPHKVLSLFLVSPLPSVEMPEVADGLEEIYNCWAEGFKDPSSVDHSALLDAVYGILQLGFNSDDSGFVQVIGNQILSNGLRNWSADNLADFRTACVAFFINCMLYPEAALGKLALLMEQRCHDAELEVDLVEIPGAGHFGSVTHADDINQLLTQFVLENSVQSTAPVPVRVTSPFEAKLRKAGWLPDDNDEEGNHILSISHALWIPPH